jgi:hypothetical protein
MTRFDSSHERKHLDRTAIQAAIGFARDDLASFATLDAIDVSRLKLPIASR